MKLKKCLSAVMIAAMTVGMVGCGSNKSTDESVAGGSGTEKAGEAKGYTYGAGETFHSDKPISYSMLFSDHENYPYKKDWKIWSAIQDKTNVSFDMNIVARTDYNDKVSTLVNTGDAPYIIPKIYSEAPYVSSGQIVPISDWVQYMPNYEKCVKDWGMESDLQQKLQSDGKYYVLPGMWQQAGGGYSLIIRKDVFEAAGVDVANLEKSWTWEDFYDACKKVKDYTKSDYVWSDQYNGAAALNLSAKMYDVRAGKSSDGGDWGLGNGTQFDSKKDKFYFADTTDSYKSYLKFWNKMYEDKIMDPETYSEDSETAMQKFFTGKSYVLTANYQQLADIEANNKMQVDGADLYMVVCPGGPAGMLQTESSRLENGIMISENALKDLGKDKFIEMLRFIDWLWYSDEGQTLSLWGVEGDTYTKDSAGKITLNSDIYYNGINPGATKKLNVDYGFGGGVFAYGGTTQLRQSKMTDGEIDFNNRIYANRTAATIAPPIMADEDQSEDLTLIQTPLMDYVNTMALSFITGKEDIDSKWDSYVKQCEEKGATKYIKEANEIFDKTKSKLTY